MVLFQGTYPYISYLYVVFYVRMLPLTYVKVMLV